VRRQAKRISLIELRSGPRDANTSTLTVGSADIFHFELQVVDGVALPDEDVLRYEVTCVVDGWVGARFTGFDPTVIGSLRDSQTDVWLGCRLGLHSEFAISTGVGIVEEVMLNFDGVDVALDSSIDRF
jgi:hypothetical protein